jgi:hypothetical protein
MRGQGGRQALPSPLQCPECIIRWGTKRPEREAYYLATNTEEDSAWSVDTVYMPEHGFACS